MTATAPPTIAQDARSGGETPPPAVPPAVVALPALRSAVQALAAVLPARTTVPVLSHLWLRCTAARLELVGSDFETAAAAVVPLDNPDNPETGGPRWQLLVPGRLLADVLTRVGGGHEEPATLVLTAPQVLKLVTPAGTASLVGADHQEFPVGSPLDEASRERPPAAQVLAVSPERLADLITQAEVAAAGPGAVERPILQCLHLSCPEWGESLANGDFGNGLELRAADGHRAVIACGSGPSMLHARTRAGDPRLVAGVLVPGKAVRLLRDLLKRKAADEQEAVTLRLLPAAADATPNLLEVALPADADGVAQLVVRIRLGQGTFPDLEPHFRARPPLVVAADAAVLLHHARMAALFAPRLESSSSLDHAPISLTLDPSAPGGCPVRLASKNADGAHKAWIAGEVLEVVEGTAPITCGVSAGYLVDCLSSAPGKRLRLALEGPHRAVQVWAAPDTSDAEGGGHYRALMMPMAGPTVPPDPGPPPGGEGESRSGGEGESRSGGEGESGSMDRASGAV